MRAYKYYTYLWLREDGTPYYVGKGKRDRGFISKGHTVKCPPRERIITQEWPSEEDAFVAEKFLILYYGREDLNTGCLRNLTEGGEGSSGSHHTTDTRRKISIAVQFGTYNSARRSKVMKGNKNGIGKAALAYKTALAHL